MRVDGEHRVGVARGLERDDADARLVEAQIEQRVVELAEGAERPRVGARFASSSGVCGSAPSGARTVSVAVRARRVELDVDVLVPSRRGASASERLELHGVNGRRFDCARPCASRRRFTALLELRLARAPRRRGPTRRARLPRTPSARVENTSARSRRILRLSTRRVRPPVPGSTPRSGASGKLTALDPSSARTISSHAIASS